MKPSSKDVSCKGLLDGLTGTLLGTTNQLTGALGVNLLGGTGEGKSGLLGGGLLGANNQWPNSGSSASSGLLGGSGRLGVNKQSSSNAGNSGLLGLDLLGGDAHQSRSFDSLSINSYQFPNIDSSTSIKSKNFTEKPKSTSAYGNFEIFGLENAKPKSN